MMGAEGLTQATRIAILNANYIAARSTCTSRSLQGRTATWPTSASSIQEPKDKVGILVEMSLSG